RNLHAGADLGNAVAADQDHLVVQDCPGPRIEQPPSLDGDDLIARREIFADALGAHRRASDGHNRRGERHGQLTLQTHELLPYAERSVVASQAFYMKLGIRITCVSRRTPTSTSASMPGRRVREPCHVGRICPWRPCRWLLAFGHIAKLREGIMMRTMIMALTAAFVATAFAVPAQAAGAKPDRAACHKMVSENPGMMVQGHRPRSYGPAVRRCMAGQPI